MRQKRLAKLAAAQQQQAQEQSQQQSQPQENSETSQPQKNPSSSSSSTVKENERLSEVPSRKINITPSPSSSSTNPANNNPFSQLGVKNRTGSGTNTPKTGDSGNNDSLKRSALPIDSASDNTSAPPPKKLQTGPGGKEEKLEDWSDRVLSDIFRVTLDETRSAESRGSSAKLTYLPELRSELEQSNEPLKLTASSIDVAILEAARYVPTSRALLDYLLPCWKRVIRALKFASRRPNPERDGVLNEAKRLCMSNCIFAVTMPEYFG